MNPITFFFSNQTIGRTRKTGHGDVVYVASNQSPEIVFKRFTADYSAVAERQYLVTATGRRYGSLITAAAAALKARKQPQETQA